jgi:hypothetical protein
MEWTDTRVLARNIDRVLMVLLSNFSKIDMVGQSRQALEAVGAHIEGFILNGARTSDAAVIHSGLFTRKKISSREK